MHKGKARSGSKAERTRQYLRILNRLATDPLGIRRGFESTFLIVFQDSLNQPRYREGFGADVNIKIQLFGGLGGNRADAGNERSRW
jgi:hypothetical protein